MHGVRADERTGMSRVASPTDLRMDPALPLLGMIATRRDAIRSVYRILNAHARGKIGETVALSDILHAARRGLKDEMPEVTCDMCKPGTG